MILVDTSAWIDFFCGTGRFSPLVDDALDTNDVALCGPVITELRRGLTSRRERARVLELLRGCRVLSMPHRLWEEAGELGFILARKGVTAKSMDLLIACYALSHGVPVLSADSDFEHMRQAGVDIQLVEA